MISIRTLAALAVALSVSAPARCAAHCRPWLVQSSLDRGAVSASLIMGNACTPDNEGFYFMRYRTRDAAGQREFVFRSADFPEQQAALDPVLKSMALLGVMDKDIDFLDSAVMSLAAEGRAAEAADAWRGYLVARASAAAQGAGAAVSRAARPQKFARHKGREGAAASVGPAQLRVGAASLAQAVNRSSQALLTEAASPQAPVAGAQSWSSEQ